MLSRSVRIILIFINALILLYFIHFNIEWGWILILPLFYQFITYFRISSIWLSYRSFQKSNYELMGKYLDEIPIAQWLSKKHRSKYFFLQGARYANKESEEEAVQFLQKALQNGLDRKNDEAIALGMLATLYMGREPKERIYDLIIQARALAETENIIKMLDKIESNLEKKKNEKE